MALRPPPPPGFVPYEPQQQIPASPVIRGTAAPRLPPPQTPTNAARDEVGLIGDRQRIENERLAAERARLQLQQDRRTAADPAGDSPTEQRRIAGFYLRAARANDLYGQHQVAPRGVVGQSLADAFPRVANSLTGAERQQAEALQREFIAPILRYESGAAVPPAEFEDARARYFPQPGDGPEVIALKARLRANALESLQRSAGPAATGIDPTNPPADGVPPVGHSVTEGALSVATELGAEDLLPASGPLAKAAPPGSPPPDPNRVQPGESMGQVGTLPNVSVDTGRNVAGTPGAVLTAHDRQIASVATALANSRLSVPETVRRINQILEADGRQLLTAGQYEAIQSARRNGARFTFTPTAKPRSQVEQIQDTAGIILGRGGAPEAAAASALDSASLGLPALFSEDYRNAMGDVREAHPIASTVGTVLGGLVAPGGPRPGMGLLEQSARSGGQGAVYAFNESGGDPENALVGGAIGLAAPGAFNLAGRVVRPVGNALLSPFRRTNVTPEMQAVAQAAEQEGVPISRPVVDPSVRDRMAYLESTPGTGNAIRTPLQATREAIEGRAGELQGPGTVQPNGVVGQQVQDAADRYIRRSGDIRTRLYDRAAQIAGDAPVRGQEAVRAIDEALAELAPNAPVNQGQISYLQNLRRTFVDDQGNLIPRTVQSIRDLRTEMRGHIDNGTLTRGPAERRVLNVLGAARQDIERDLGAQNPAAVRAYQRADRFNAERASEIRQVVQRVIGRSDDRLSGEQVMTRLRTMAGNGGDADRLRRLWDKLSPEEQADAAATIASTAGRKSAEEGFEPGQFIAWSRTLSPEARQVIFGPQGAQSIANLRVLSKALMDTTSRLNNSRSGVVANWGRVFRDALRGGPVGAGLGLVAGGSALASGGAGLALGGASAVAGTVLRKLSARALMNPDMSRWLAGATRAATPSAIRQHIARLAVVERSNPALTQEITGLRQALLNAVNDNALPATGRAAASPDEGPNHE